MAKKKSSKKGINKKQIGIGAAVAASVAAAAAGAYFLYGSKNAARNRKKVKGWMLKARGEVLEQIEKMKHISKGDYEKLVDTVMARYQKMSSTSGAEVNALKRELKNHWRHIRTSASGSKKRSSKKSVRKKVTKKKSRRRS